MKTLWNTIFQKKVVENSTTLARPVDFNILFDQTHELIWLYYHRQVSNDFRSRDSFARNIFRCKTHGGIIKSRILLRPWSRICIYKWSACPGHITINIRPAPVQMCKWSKQIWKCSYLVIGHFLLDETSCSRWLKHNWEPIFITTMLISYICIAHLNITYN